MPRPNRRETDGITRFERPWKLISTIVATLVGLAGAIVLTVGAIVSSKLSDFNKEVISQLARRAEVQQQLSKLYDRIRDLERHDAAHESEINAARDRLNDLARRVDK